MSQHSKRKLPTRRSKSSAGMLACRADAKGQVTAC